MTINHYLPRWLRARLQKHAPQPAKTHKPKEDVAPDPAKLKRSYIQSKDKSHLLWRI